MGKNIKSFRLSEKTITELESLARRWQLGQTETLAIIIHAAGTIGFEDEDQVNALVELAKRI
jgi:hypothetical protein